MEYNNDIFSRENYKRIRYNAAMFPAPARERVIWDSMDACIEHFSRIEQPSNIDVLLAMGVAYSWMPTMLRIYDATCIDDINQVVQNVQFLRSINSFRLLCNEENNALEAIAQLSTITNNSVVGASKVLHLFSPKFIPIIDRRVIRAWNWFYSQYPTQLIKSNCHPNGYLEYWKAMLYWKGKIQASSVRKLEKPFFDYGGYLNRSN